MISVIIPAYNEARRIEKTIKKIEETLVLSGEEFEILAVNDGSQDETLSVLQQIKSEHLVVLTYEKNRGKGGAVRYGIENARGKYLVFTDADLPYAPENIMRAKEKLEEDCDVVLGSRVQKENGGKYPWYRNVMSNTFSFFVNMMLHLHEKDTQCGFKAFTKDAAKEIFKRITLSGWGFDVELIFIAKKLGFCCKRLPVELFHDNKGSKIHVVRDTIRMLKEVLCVKKNDKQGIYQ